MSIWTPLKKAAKWAIIWDGQQKKPGEGAKAEVLNLWVGTPLEVSQPLSGVTYQRSSVASIYTMVHNHSNITAMNQQQM